MSYKHTAYIYVIRITRKIVFENLRPCLFEIFFDTCCSFREEMGMTKFVSCVMPFFGSRKKKVIPTFDTQLSNFF